MSTNKSLEKEDRGAFAFLLKKLKKNVCNPNGKDYQSNQWTKCFFPVIMINRLRKYTLCDGILFFSKLLRFCGLEMVVLVGVNVILSFGKYKVKVNWALISFLAINFHRKKHFWGHEHSTLTAIANDWRVDVIFKVVFSYCSSAVEFRCGNFPSYCRKKPIQSIHDQIFNIS